jgi:hypothetical protein
MVPNLVPFRHQYCEEYGWVEVVEDGDTSGYKEFAITYRELNEMDYIQCPAQTS